MHCNQDGFIPAMQEYLGNGKSINANHYMKPIEGEKLF